MSLKQFGAFAVAVFVVFAGLASTAQTAEKGSDDEAKLLKALANSKHTLAAGIEQAAAKAPEAAISAKFEFEDGKLSLSVYTVGKGLSVEAEHNVLKELAGSPEADKWAPETETFKDVEHVSRASEQLTLMALTRQSLTDVVKKASKDQPGTVFSITPKRGSGKPVFVVLVAAKDKVVELHYDLMTGEKLAAPTK